LLKNEGCTIVSWTACVNYRRLAVKRGAEIRHNSSGLRRLIPENALLKRVKDKLLPKLGILLLITAKFIGLVVACDVIGGRNFPVKNLSGKSCGCAMFSQTIPRDIFLEIMNLSPL